MAHMTVRRRFARIAASAGLLTLALAAPAAGNKSFVVADRCDGFGALVPADADAVRSIGKIPDEFRLRNEATGVTDVLVGAFICDPVSIDGADVGSFLYSNVTVGLEKHPGGYDIWQFTDLPEFQSRLRAIGIFAPLLKNMSVEIETAAGAPASGSADIPWPGSPYTINAAIGPLSAPLLVETGCEEQQDGGGCFPSDHWFKGPQGTVYAAHSNCEFELSPALVTIRTATGSPLSQMLGAEALILPGFRGRAEATALWDFEEAFKEGRATRPECEEIP